MRAEIPIKISKNELVEIFMDAFCERGNIPDSDEWNIYKEFINEEIERGLFDNHEWSVIFDEARSIADRYVVYTKSYVKRKYFGCVCQHENVSDLAFKKWVEERVNKGMITKVVDKSSPMDYRADKENKIYVLMQTC